ncbi:MAG TPA: multicopper oxidase domain-containing protein [Dermatophilaceae bacterium]
MRFDVGAPVGVDRPWIPPVIPETNNLVPAAVSLPTARLRTVQAGEITGGMPQLGNAITLLKWTTSDANPVTKTPYLGSTEAWAMRNHSPDAHPIHEHLTELRLVGRWPVTAWGHKDAQGVTQPGQDPKPGTAFPVTVGAFQAPGAWESGPKDTFVAPRDYITVWVAKHTIAGLSVWHCHILSHEDMMAMGDDGAMRDGMMRPLKVQTKTPQTQLPRIGTQNNLDKLIRVQAAT